MREGDGTSFVLAILAGVVKLTGISSTGREALLGIRAGGDVVGEIEAIDSQSRMASVTAAGPVTARIIRQPEFLAFISRHPAASLALTRAITDQLRWATKSRIDFTTVPADIRLMRVILHLAETYGVPGADGLHIAAPLTQGELSSLAGVSEPTAQRVIRQLRELGILATGYRALNVRDLPALQELAGRDA
jgi:CRP-like cAMP-binding protein